MMPGLNARKDTNLLTNRYLFLQQRVLPRAHTASFEWEHAIRLFEELFPGRRSNGEYRGVLQFPFRTDCIEMSPNLLRRPDCAQ